MAKFGIVIDSTVYLSEEEVQQYDMRKVSLNIMDGETTYKELEVNNEFVYDILDNGRLLTTSQPSPGEFLTTYEELLNEGVDKIFVLTIAEALSGTYQSAVLARNMLDTPDKVHIFHSIMAAYGNEMLALELGKMVKANKSYEEIVKRINLLNDNSHLVFTIENLKTLVHSGRLSKAKALIGRIIRLKPMLYTKQGKLDLYKATRTHKKIFKETLDYMHNTLDNFKKQYVRIISKQSPQQAKALTNEIKKEFPNATIAYTDYIGPVFSAHLGAKGYGVSWTGEE